MNSTFNFQAGDNVNGEVLNATVVIEDSTIHKLGATQGELNATFPVEINEPAIEEDFSPCNNNVYNLNSTFQTIVSVNRSVSATATISLKPVLNTTYSEEEAVQVAPVPANNVGSSRQCSLDELNELDELEDVDRCDVNEMVFRKPLMPGAVPKRPLIRTSTWNNEIPGSPKKQLIGPVITPPSTNGMKDVEKFAKIQEDSKFKPHRNILRSFYKLTQQLKCWIFLFWQVWHKLLRRWVNDDSAVTSIVSVCQ